MTINMDRVAFVGDTLGALFRFEPTSVLSRPLLDTFSAVNADELCHEWPFGQEEELRRGFPLMCQSGLTAQGTLDEILWEYRRLFVGPGHVAVPLWGSVYTDRECVVFGKATLELRHWMKANGIKRSEEEKNPEDHFGTLLLLMSWIARNKPECLDEYLCQHVLPWAGHMLCLLESEAQLDFFKGLAIVTKATLDGLQTQVTGEVKQVRFFK